MNRQLGETPMNRSRREEGVELALFFIAFFVLVAAMMASYYYPYPSGRPPDVASFLIFWVREVLILGCFAVVVLSILCLRVARHVRRMLGSKGDAP